MTDKPNSPIEEMTNRFLSWRLPDNFNPDGYVSFVPPEQEVLWPSGTNLLDYSQAKAMVEHITADLIDTPPPDEGWTPWGLWNPNYDHKNKPHRIQSLYSYPINTHATYRVEIGPDGKPDWGTAKEVET